MLTVSVLFCFSFIYFTNPHFIVVIVLVVIVNFVIVVAVVVIAIIVVMIVVDDVYVDDAVGIIVADDDRMLLLQTLYLMSVTTRHRIQQSIQT